MKGGLKAMKNNDINYGLVETVRPPIYTCMKYWGKKPHNIWSEYIKTYTPENGIYMDPFCGSGVGIFEAFRAGRRAIGLDINPLSSFIIEVVFSEFNKENFIKEYEKITIDIENDPIYKKYFLYRNDMILQNCKYKDGCMYECCFLDNKGKKIVSEPDFLDIKCSDFSSDESAFDNLFYPKEKFRNSDAFSPSFLKGIGESFDCLYTKRNLYVLTKIFEKILKISCLDLKKQFLYAFIQSVHLCTKMCVPRGKSSNRDFSTSWGRCAYLFSKNQMEMNPLLIFKNSCCGRQSVLKALTFAKTYFPKKPKIKRIDQGKLIDLNENIDIWYGTLDSKKLDSVIKKNTIDFVLTDPPYGGLVKYLDLSNIWLSWLSIFDKRFVPAFSQEITIDKNKSSSDFKNDLTEVFLKINYVLKDKSKMVLTFNNNDLNIRSSFLGSIKNSDFIVEKVILQQNKRTGESNVSNPFGSSANDFYIRCVKGNYNHKEKACRTGIETQLINKIKEVILNRGEPTPYLILFNGLLSEFSSLSLDLSNFDKSFFDLIYKNENKIFLIEKNTHSKSGDYIWLKNVKFSESEKTLSYKLRQLILNILRANEEIDENNLMQTIFVKFPNGLTPEISLIYKYLNESAYKKGKKWVYNGRQ